MGNVVLWGRMGEIWRGRSRGIAVGIGSVAFLPEILPSIQASFCWSRAWQAVQSRLTFNRLGSVTTARTWEWDASAAAKEPGNAL